MSPPDHPNEQDHRAMEAGADRMTLADHILCWLAAGSMQRDDLDERAHAMLSIRDISVASARVGLVLLHLTRRGLVSLHPVRGFCLTPAGKEKHAREVP